MANITDEEIEELLKTWDEECVPQPSKKCVISPAARNKCVGYHCNRCKDFFEFAEPNQKDGSFKCFSCRNY